MAQIKGAQGKFHETTALVNRHGTLVDSDNPLRVSLGGDNITITGSVNVGSTVEITNDDGSPIPTHTHLFDSNDNEYGVLNPLPVELKRLETLATKLVDSADNQYGRGNPLPVFGTVDVDEFGGIDVSGSTMPVSGTVTVNVNGILSTKLVDSADNQYGYNNPLPVDIGASSPINTKLVDSADNQYGHGNPVPIVGTTANPFGRQILLVDDDTVQHTSHNRRKVSTYEITDFATFPFSKNEIDFDELITGTASSTHNPYLGMVELSVDSSAGDQIIRQTRRVQRYLPGRANQADFAVILDGDVGIRTRVGVFNETNGAYFEHDGTDYYCVIRRNTAGGVVEERTIRSNWSDDKLDGTGPSGITLDATKIQMMVIEYEWYGAGQVEWKFVIDNNAYSAHRVSHANFHDHTWASYGSFPIRYELTNVTGVTGTHSMYQGSHSFLTEGAAALLGRQLSVSSPVTGYNLATAGTFYPVLAVRLKSTALNSVVIPDEYSAGLLDKTDMFIRVMERVTSVTGGTWVSAGDESPIEYNITATSFTGGDTASTTFVSEKQMGAKLTFPERVITQIGRRTTTTLGDTSEIFLISASATDNTKDAWVSLGWIEVR